MQAIHIPIGTRFERLIVLEQVPNKKNLTYRCQCDCGNQTTTHGNALRNGRTQSCGCLGRERRLAGVTKHGLTPNNPKLWHPLYRTWLDMKSRCYNPNFPKFKDYGARGIKMCVRWKNDFTAFLTDMGERPAPGMSIDRKNNDGDYCKRNCRWATPKQQANNRRKMTK
jgi:hypothetical protein